MAISVSVIPAARGVTSATSSSVPSRRRRIFSVTTPRTSRMRPRATISAFQSLDGTTFEPIGEPQDYGSLPRVTYAGIAIAAGRDGQYTRARFDVPSLKIEPK